MKVCRKGNPGKLCSRKYVGHSQLLDHSYEPVVIWFCRSSRLPLPRRNGTHIVKSCGVRIDSTHNCTPALESKLCTGAVSSLTPRTQTQALTDHARCAGQPQNQRRPQMQVLTQNTVSVLSNHCTIPMCLSEPHKYKGNF